MDGPRPAVRPMWREAGQKALAPPGAGAVDLWLANAVPGPAGRDAGRALVRGVLARYVGGDPAALVLADGPHGKPALDPPVVRFSVAHSATVLLVAVSSDAELGVDVEVARPGRDVLRPARRVWGEAVAQELAGLAPAEREARFHRDWVRHEARLKCHGVGFAAPAPPVLVTVLDLELPDGSAAALARAGGPPARVRGLRLTPA